MPVEIFKDNDEGYRIWLAANPDGFVLNASRNPSADYLKLHQASCRTISGAPARGSTWTKDYIKACSPTVDELGEWARLNTGGTLETCGTCQPALSVIDTIGRTPGGVSIAGWVLKGDPTVYDVDAELEEHGVIENWSVSDNYRSKLMSEGQRCVLWRSGPNGALIAAGQITGPVYVGDSDPDSWIDKEKARKAELFVPVVLNRLTEEISRSALKAHPVLSQVEFLRVKQMSNPSILTPKELESLEDLLVDIEPSNDLWLAAISAGDAHWYVPTGAEADDVPLLGGRVDEDLVEVGRYGSTMAALLAAVDMASPEIAALLPVDPDFDETPIIDVRWDDDSILWIFKVEDGFWAVRVADEGSELIADDKDLVTLLSSLLE